MATLSLREEQKRYRAVDPAYFLRMESKRTRPLKAPFPGLYPCSLAFLIRRELIFGPPHYPTDWTR